MTTAISFNGVSFAYCNTPVLNDVSFALPTQSISVLFGPSGSGKTTCLRLIAGLETPSSGAIQLFGNDAAALQPHQREVGYCFQEPALWQAVTVSDHIRLCLKNGKADKQAVQPILQEYYLEHVAHHYPNQLSGGEKKRLDFARAAASTPKILLLDEPLSSLEEPLREELIQTIEHCRENGGTVVAVTHQRDEMFTLAEYMVILHNGSVMNEGKPEEVYHHPKNRMTAELLGLKNIFPVTVENGIIRTPFGSMKTDCQENGEWLAGCSVHDIELSLHEPENAVITSSTFHAGAYFVKMMMDGKPYQAETCQHWEKGKPIRAWLKQSPVLIGNKPKL